MIANTLTEPRFRVLLIDDDPAIHDLVTVMLKSESIDLATALDCDQAVKSAKQILPDLILLDYVLPGANGLEVLARLRAQAVPENTPIVFITGNDSHRVLTACFQAGAADYIRKPFCASELCARVHSVLDRKHLLGRLEEVALHDPLTSLCNRASMRNRLQAAISRASVSNYALLFLDFDRFKLVNDSLGHNVGDELLKRIADRLRTALNSPDSMGELTRQATAARLGGDEFVVLLEQLANPNDAVIVARRLVSMLEEPYFIAGHHVSCTASIGVVNHIHHYVTPEEVLRDADTAMYEAKSAGKGRYVLFDQKMHANAEHRLRIEHDLRAAVPNSQLLLAYQPVVSLETGRLQGIEALARWQHPERGLMLPNAFLPTAEESGLIVPIGNWVLDQACEQFATWRRTLGEHAPTTIHVNISRKQLLHDLASHVRIALKKHAIAPECLHLEVAESEIMMDLDVAKSALQKLRQIGVRIAMDDFGTGQSSLARLQELPIDVLKIDRSLIANMQRSRSFAAVVHAVTTLGQNLGLKVVAEGIETADHLAMLQSMECELGQGYLFARPMSADQINHCLEQTDDFANSSTGDRVRKEEDVESASIVAANA